MSLVEDIALGVGTVTLFITFISILDKVFSYWLLNKYDRETIWKIIKQRSIEREEKSGEQK